MKKYFNKSKHTAQASTNLKFTLKYEIVTQIKRMSITVEFLL